MGFLIPVLTLLALPVPAQQPTPQGKQPQISREELNEWYQRNTAVFDDQDAVARGEQLLAAACDAHGGLLALRAAGGLRLGQRYHFVAAGEIRTRRPQTTHLLADSRGVVVVPVPSNRDRMGQTEDVRAIFDGERAWMYAEGRDETHKQASVNARNRVQRERLLSGFPFAYADEGVEVAFTGASEALGQKTWRLRVALPRDVALYRRESVELLNLEVYQESGLVAAVDHMVFFEDRELGSGSYCQIRHEFVPEYITCDWPQGDDVEPTSFRVSTLRLTTLSSRGDLGVEQRIESLEAGPPPDEYFVRGWELFTDLPTPTGTGG